MATSEFVFGSQPTVLISAVSDRWASALTFHFQQLGGMKVVKTSQEQLFEQTQSLKPVLAMIELELSTVKSICQAVFRFRSAVSNSVFVGVGEAELVYWLPLLRASGLAECCVDLVYLERLAKRIARHAKLVATANDSGFERTLEDRIESALPWQPVAKLASVGG